MRAKILFAEIADLSQGIRMRDSLILAKDREIERCNSSKVALKEAIKSQEKIIAEKDFQIENLGDINRNSKKAWRNRTLYFSAGSLVVGFITGLIIMR